MSVRSTSGSELQKGDQPWEGRLDGSHEPMNKNLVLSENSNHRPFMRHHGSHSVATRQADHGSSPHLLDLNRNPVQ
jgi:hypothetical protein